jgi:hypothetical protein
MHHVCSKCNKGFTTKIPLKLSKWTKLICTTCRYPDIIKLKCTDNNCTVEYETRNPKYTKCMDCSKGNYFIKCNTCEKYIRKKKLVNGRCTECYDITVICGQCDIVYPKYTKLDNYNIYTETKHIGMNCPKDQVECETCTEIVDRCILDTHCTDDKLVTIKTVKQLLLKQQKKFEDRLDKIAKRLNKVDNRDEDYNSDDEYHNYY